MALGQQRNDNRIPLLSLPSLPHAEGHVSYDKPQTGLIATDFDRFVETQCRRRMRHAVVGGRCRRGPTSACC
jgi:hypothetical protein